MQLNFRAATESDLPALVQMLADDTLGASREDASMPPNPRYVAAFGSIQNDPNNELIVVSIGDTVVGTLQLTFIPYLSLTGSWRCVVEAVRIHADYRGQGIGPQLFEWAIEQARERGCQLIQLTSDKQRADAIRFYRNLGFVDSHEGFKLVL